MGAHTVDVRKEVKEEVVAALFSGVTVLGAHTVDEREKVKEEVVATLL